MRNVPCNAITETWLQQVPLHARGANLPPAPKRGTFPYGNFPGDVTPGLNERPVGLDTCLNDVSLGDHLYNSCPTPDRTLFIYCCRSVLHISSIFLGCRRTSFFRARQARLSRAGYITKEQRVLSRDEFRSMSYLETYKGRGSIRGDLVKRSSRDVKGPGRRTNVTRN